MVKDESTIMLRRVLFFDLIIGYVITTVLYFACRTYAGPFLAGLVAAYINFFASAMVTRNNLAKGNRGNSITYFINFFRILTICLVALVFFSYNIYCVIAYMLGFSSHFIGLVLYAIFNKDTK